MRKALILATALVGIGGLFAAAKASHDKVPDKDDAQLTRQTENPGEEAKELGAPHNESFHEARERSHQERRQVHEEEDEDRD